MTAEPLSQLKRMARHVIDLGRRQSMEYADDIMRLPPSVYFDENLFKLEMERIFHRVPIILGPTCELANPGDFKTMRVAGSSILVTRGKDGEVRGFMNACRHRGVKVETKSDGHQTRFTCPFHGWTYALDGRLIGVAAQKDFGIFEKADHSLRQFPVLERAGLIWAIINPETKLTIEPFLLEYDKLLAQFKMDEWKFFSKRTFKGPNWKLSYDGYLEFYHVPVLHSTTFGTDSTTQGIYYSWGPHQHIKTPDLTKNHIATETLGYMASIADKPEAEWDLETLCYGVWTVFPCISIASFSGGGRGIMISQVLPGENVGESTTTQFYIMEKLPDTEARAAHAEEQFAFVQAVVEGEDITQAYSAQETLPKSGIEYLHLGRNERGNQHFHKWCQKIVDAETDADLMKLFLESPIAYGIPK